MLQRIVFEGNPTKEIKMYVHLLKKYTGLKLKKFSSGFVLTAPEKNLLIVTNRFYILDRHGNTRLILDSRNNKVSNIEYINPIEVVGYKEFERDIAGLDIYVKMYNMNNKIISLSFENSDLMRYIYFHEKDKSLIYKRLGEIYKSDFKSDLHEILEEEIKDEYSLLYYIENIHKDTAKLRKVSSRFMTESIALKIDMEMYFRYMEYTYTKEQLKKVGYF